MREIKFRAWDEVNNKWIDGCDLIMESSGCVWAGDINNPPMIKIKSENVVFFTGLKDKYGKDIYEGDIVQFTVFDCFDNDKQFNGVVKFAEGQWQIWNSTESEYYGSDGAFDLWYVNQQDDEFEIVSNIYENPQLLDT